MEDHVTYAQAVKLKELGFDWECGYYYDESTQKIKSNTNDSYGELSTDDLLFNNNRLWKCISAPTLSQAQKWLREVKGIYVDVFLNASGYGWELNKTKPIYETNGTRLQQYDFKGEHEDSGMWLTYEKALSAGIDAALELLK